MLVDHFPLLGLRITTPRLELRLPSEDELAALADLAAEGVHDPETMPFREAWTDQPAAMRARSVVQYQWRCLGALSEDDWTLNFAVLLDGVVVGQQSIAARQFATIREVGTGSWLGRQHHGKGIGTEMRTAVLHFAFESLLALEATSGAFDDNPASQAVSRKLGYEFDGLEHHAVRGSRAVLHRFRLTQQQWRNYASVQTAVTGLDLCLPLLGCQPAGHPDKAQTRQKPKSPPQ